MFERLMDLYKNGALSQNGLERAVKRKWITDEQKNEIILNRQETDK